MKKVSLLAASIALALTGCGGSDDSGSGAAPAPGGIIITAIDGYLQHAEVWVDTDNNLTLDTSDDTLLNDLTDVNGKFTLPTKYEDHAVFIKAIANQTIDSTRGLVTKDFELAMTAGSTVINPMTNMVVDQLATDETLTQEIAEQNVVNSVTNSGLEVSDELIFGDYVADDSEEAKALNVIGETLVDNHDLPVEKQLELTDAVADETKIIIDDNNADDDPSNDKDLNDFSPIVDIPENPDDPITISPNSRPIVVASLAPVTLTLGDAWVGFSIAEHFTDIDGDVLTFSLKELTDTLNGFEIDPTTGIINGVPALAGNFNYQIFAEDAHGSLSYPLNLKVTIESPNTAPIINESEITPLQADIDVWALVEGEQPAATINIASLFTDADNDVLTYRVNSTLTVDNGQDTEFQVLVNSDGDISFDGAIPRAAESGVETLSVWAKDGINEAEAEHTFTLPKIEESTVLPPITIIHQLEDQILHFAEIGSNGTDYDSAWCDSIYFNSTNNGIYFNKRNNREDNNQECTTESVPFFEYAGEYEIKNNVIKSINFETDGISYKVIESEDDEDSSAHYVVNYTENYNNNDSTVTAVTEVYAYYKHASVVEDEVLYNPVGRTKDNAPFVSRRVHTNMPNQSIYEFDVSGIVQQFNYVGYEDKIYTHTVAQLYADNPKRCSALVDTYAINSIKVHGSNNSNDNYFTNPVMETNADGSCYINLTPQDMNKTLPLGLYTIEVKPKNLDEGERILFSFINK